MPFRDPASVQALPIDPDPFDGLPDGASVDGAWLELSVLADPEAVEAVCEILSRVAPGGTSVEPAFDLVDDGLGARVDPTRPAVVRAHLPARDRAAARAALRRVREDLGHLQAFGLRPIGEVTARVVVESDWAGAWKRHVGVMRIGRGIVIRPSWRRHRPAPGETVVALDPGMAFGTGLHPTTRLCVAGIERWADEGLVARGAAAGGGPARVLDVGCGSGILAIVSARLGAARVVGVDTDPIAVEATVANARRNHVARRVRAVHGSLPAPGGPFDLVLANLIAGVLVALAPHLADAVRPGGRLLASGIFVDREGEVRDAFAAAGLAVVDRATEGDWVALDVTRPRSDAGAR
ncbi:MAG: 50S ribosomal protein L11 methyltransferase [Chloroflexi bacterium]|nr:50S ribosomal protein L11 methyltransferase [Chloroflexota bacterium]